MRSLSMMHRRCAVTIRKRPLIGEVARWLCAEGHHEAKFSGISLRIMGVVAKFHRGHLKKGS